MNTHHQYDFIIAGSGCAGLSLAIHMIGSGKFSDHRILLVDKDIKNKNDRTWCFWEQGQGLFQSVVHKEWEQLSFLSNSFQKKFDTHPYKYKMIRGLDFYNHCRSVISKHPNFHVMTSEITAMFSDEKGTGVKFGSGETIHCKKIFSSVLPDAPDVKGKTWLLQHFKGWTIEAAPGSFDPRSATLMDFRTGQEEGTTFCYVLPLCDRKALVEYTVFSRNILQKEDYDVKLREYIQQVLRLGNYNIVEEEFGVIPMTDHSFPSQQGNIIYIGTAGGQTKGSTGYTFQYIQKHSRQLVEELLDGTSAVHVKKRHLFYDSVLLGVLENKLMRGDEVFSRMFRKNKPATIFRFLDNESSLREEIGIISTLPTLPFLKSAIKKMF